MSMTDIASRLTSAVADRYDVLGEVGAGGMATVFRAHDRKHDRTVAIKVLHPDLGAALGGDRFLSEIRTTARLQHPHILGLLDSGAADGLLFYVMPFVRGETLRARLTRETQLPVADALAIATAVADALAEAHAAGIVHRDIKPENILLQQSAQGSQPLVADFGIALAVQTAGGARMTQTGLSLGTPQYMAPEQAMGDKVIDARADTYALGAVLYEMLTGEPPYTGANAQAIVAKLLTEAPRPIRVLRPAVPEHIEAAVRTALQKLPADRFASIEAFKAALRAESATTRQAATAGRDRPGAFAKRWLPFAALLLAATSGGGWFLGRRTTPPVPQTRVEFAFNPGPRGSSQAVVAMAPDGRAVLQVVSDSARGSIVVQRFMGSTAVVPVLGSEGGSTAHYSPDGKWISFWRNGALYRIPVDGGTATVLADVANTGVTATTPDGWVYFSPSASEGLSRVRESGGPVEVVTRPNPARKELGHWYPTLLPGARTLLFGAYAAPAERSSIQALDLATGKVTAIIDNAFFPRYVAPGYLLFGRDNALFAAPFDADKVALLGPAVPVVEDVYTLQTDGSVAYDVSANGDLVYIKGSLYEEKNRVVWVSRDGTRRDAFPELAGWADPRLSPDGRWIALTRSRPEPWSLWLFDRERQTLNQLSRANGATFAPVWAPDSKSLYHAVETPAYDLARTAIDGATVDTLLRTGNDKHPTGISPDGRTLVYSEVNPLENLWTFDVGTRQVTRVDATRTRQLGGVISPDGRWLALSERQADGRVQVIVRACTGATRVQISVAGGDQPRFTRGGREIVFRNGRDVYAAPFDPATGVPGAPVRLFQLAVAGRINQYRTTGYDVTADGSQFLMVEPVERPEVLPVRVILGWRAELVKKVPRP